MMFQWIVEHYFSTKWSSKQGELHVYVILLAHRTWRWLPDFFGDLWITEL